NEAGARGAEAERLLVTLAAPARVATIAAWARMGAVGRRRAVRLLARGAADEELSRAALSTAAADEDADVRSDAVAALAAAMPATASTLAEIVRGRGPAEDAAAMALARRAGDGGTAVLLEAIAAEGGSERPMLREALRLGADRGGDAARGAV